MEDNMENIYTREDLANHSKEELITIIMGLQYELANNIGTGTKWGDIKPEYIAELHLSGYSLTEIVNKINKRLKDEGRVDKKGKPLVISLQTVRYKLSKYEQETGQNIYRPATKGRKKIKPTVFD